MAAGQNQEVTSLLRPLKYALSSGNLIGLLPLHPHRPCGRSWRRLTPAVGTVLLAVNFGYSALRFCRSYANGAGLDAVKMAKETRTLFFDLTAFFIYAYFFLRHGPFLRVLEGWDTCIKSLRFPGQDKQLHRDASRLSVILLAWTALGMGLHAARPLSIPSIILLLANKMAFLAWTTLDLIIMILARALAFRFQLLLQVKEPRSPEVWQSLRRDHLGLRRALATADRFLSPLLFLSFSLNIYSVCLEFQETVAPFRGRDWLESVYRLWLLSHLLLRLGLLTREGARLHDNAHAILDQIQKAETVTQEMERLERYLGGNLIGLSGLDCFLLSRPLVILILSLTFTIEIVLLQASAAARTNN